MPFKSEQEVPRRERVASRVPVEDVDEREDISCRLMEGAGDEVGNGLDRERLQGNVGRASSCSEELSNASDEGFALGSEGGDDEHPDLGGGERADESQRGLVGVVKVVEKLKTSGRTRRSASVRSRLVLSRFHSPSSTS